MRETRDSIQDVWGTRTPYRDDWPARVDERIIDEPERWVPGTCVLCSNGCAMDVGVKGGRIVGVRGRDTDISNRGRLGPKGLHGWEANASPDRLTSPLVRRGGRLEEASWDEAMELLVRRSRELIERHSPLSIGIYSTGQLFLEEYYTLALVAKAGLRTPHTDANTRLCTATAGAALMESFGTDGQPACYRDIDLADALFHVGHNVAEQQTGRWMRILDRRHGPNPPRMIVVDPRATVTAKEADLHLAPRLGTNVALMNGLLHLLIAHGHIDRAYIDAHTVGFSDLERTTAGWLPQRVETVTGVPARQVEAAAELLGSAPTLVSTVLQGVYQSHQATAAAVQVNNLHLIRGLIGKPGAGILQMNGQPTSQNTRECGVDGSMAGFRNFQNPRHVADLARLWNVDPESLPDRATHAMQIFRYAEQGSIRMLWIIATNPAVSAPDLPRMRRILERDDLFVVVQDAFLTETAARADLVLPAAMWGEKSGTFTNTDRVVHLSRKAVDPPGQARADFDIFLDYARRMDLRDRDGAPLIKWTDPEGAFEAWKECSRGRPCDYSGLSYARLGAGSGIRWPCNEQFPDGAERLYADGVFGTDKDYCEGYGHDFVTGAAVTGEQYVDPAGKAFLRPAEYQPAVEEPDAEYPLWLTTGRLVYHWHTRTKTGRARRLQEAAPHAFVQLADEDAARHGIAEGMLVEITSRRGTVVAPARVGDVRPGVLFMPFHYGYWDHPDGPCAANELTVLGWDPVSKQPYLKFAAVRIKAVPHAEEPEAARPERVSEGERSDGTVTGVPAAEH